ncbi:serine hydrolase [Sphingomonas sp.]|uniref:serine hydrolase domain-containing protein n=1 Tax=Sphingomonas sp. TaxID=28214 RepID=UPI002D80202C|nr:serine hydrolase [Sphingomonas sp.]HEU0045052.1 serine hydrolase [Sphingomonas sp.]
MYCSGIFSAGRTSAQIDRDELAGIYAEYEAIVPTLTATVDRKTASVTVAYDPVMPPRRAAWQPGTGCVTERIGLAAPAAPATFRRPPAPVKADPRPWPQGDRGIAPRPAPPLAAAVGRAFDGSHGAGAKTTGVIVLRDGAVMAERYAAGWGPFVSNRTWSAGKSLAGTLIGWAAGSANGPVPLRPNTGYLWPRAGDPRGAITLDHLLRMASGLHSDTAGNRTDAIYFGGTAVDEQALGWPLAARPGTRFRYANNDTLLAVYMMRLAIGEDRYRAIPTDFLATLGMTHTQPGTDWRGNYILSSQVWSTARDLARLGQFWLQDGVWQGKRLLPAGWIRYMSSPSGPQPASGPGYGATLWLFGPKQGLPEGSYAAQGNRGQYIMVIPSAQLVIVRRGEDPGSARFDIAKFAADVLAAAP